MADQQKAGSPGDAGKTGGEEKNKRVKRPCVVVNQQLDRKAAKYFVSEVRTWCSFSRTPSRKPPSCQSCRGGRGGGRERRRGKRRGEREERDLFQLLHRQEDRQRDISLVVGSDAAAAVGDLPKPSN